MQSSLPVELGDTLVVLGAGATRASAELTPHHPEHPEPPLDSDFFTQLQRVRNRKHQASIKLLLKYCWKEFGPAWNLSMESFFNHIWYSQWFVNKVRVRTGATVPSRTSGESIKVKKDVQQLFRDCLLAVLEESLFGQHSQDCLKLRCKWHDLIAASADEKDTFVSFNYDCLIDASLCQRSDYWDPLHSYGFPVVDDGGCKYWRGNAKPNTAIKLLKLHGSVNWQQKGNAIKLLQRPYTTQKGSRRFVIIPPVVAKETALASAPIFERIWQIAYKRMCYARSVIICGYSLPPADALANALFTARAHGFNGQPSKALEYLIIANPIKDVRHRLIRTFRRSIDSETRVLVFDGMKEMCQHCFRADGTGRP
ncbi:MAG: hypothetical protein GIKADHBN_00420 [Phycisphaerales bacterium]|nr:hypothetical protein [Phycisphaerales bacterium]